MVWKWNGQGFLPGVPERDIEASEAEELGIADLLAASPAYTQETDAEPEEDADDPEPDVDAGAASDTDAAAEEV